MEYQELVSAQLDEWERQAARIRRSNEARRLNGGEGHSWANPLAHFDSLVLRASKGAADREARRHGHQTPEQLA